jgi:hypothetical protein
MSRSKLLLAGFSLLFMASFVAKAADADTHSISHDRMQAIFNEVKTPFKYGVVLEPPAGKKVDCPNVFRHGGKWYMIYVQLEIEPQGYTTQLAESNDLLHWKPLGTILQRGQTNSWDHANAGGGIALFDTKWGASNTLQSHDSRYWLSYIGGELFGYEKIPLAIGIASTSDPSKPDPWQKLPSPVLKSDDADARAQEKDTLYKSYIFRDETRTLGAPFVMFYNAKPPRGSEQIFAAVSDDLQTWKRFGTGPTLENLPPVGSERGVISGDPQVVRMGDVWVMFLMAIGSRSGH